MVYIGLAAGREKTVRFIPKKARFKAKTARFKGKMGRFTERIQ